MKKTLRRGDIVIVIFVLLLSVVLVFLTGRISGKQGETVRITSGGKTSEYSLSENKEFKIENGGYTLYFVIENGGVRVTDADCPDKTCKNTGRISKSGERIVCLPARVTAEIVGGQNEVIVAG